jgi:DNA-binding NarL/FixJ family response regulator
MTQMDQIHLIHFGQHLGEAVLRSIGFGPDARERWPMVEGAAPSIHVTVVVIDDHQLVVDALERVLLTNPRVSLVGRAASIAEGLTVVAECAPDVVVMDYRFPDGSGIDATRTIKAMWPSVEVVLLTGFADGAVLARALEAGCAGFVSKGGRFDELVSVIEAVAAGQVRVPAELLEGLVTHLRPRADNLGQDLTAREMEVLVLLSAGRSTSDIADELVVSIHTVRNHIRNLLAKLHASSRLEAVAAATRAGLIGRGG